MNFDSKACAEFYKENGYFIYENALTPAEIADLRNETTHICRGEAGPVRGLQAADGLSDGFTTSRSFPRGCRPRRSTKFGTTGA